MKLKKHVFPVPYNAGVLETETERLYSNLSGVSTAVWRADHQVELLEGDRVHQRQTELVLEGLQ